MHARAHINTYLSPDHGMHINGLPRFRAYMKALLPSPIGVVRSCVTASVPHVQCECVCVLVTHVTDGEEQNGGMVCGMEGKVSGRSK